MVIPFSRIHPRDKEDMGTRLSLAGRAVVYGQNVTFSGPFPSEFTVDTKTLTVLIKYDNGNANIRIVGKIGFEVSFGITGVFPLIDFTF